MNPTELRELAEKATPGPWNNDGPYWHDRRDGEVDCTGCVTTDPERKIVATPAPANANGNADCAFIAAADPSTVIALLDRLAAAEAIIRGFAEYAVMFEHRPGDMPDINVGVVSLADLRAARAFLGESQP